MFKFQRGDYKLVFEYDSVEELQQYLQVITDNLEKIEQTTQRYSLVKNQLDREDRRTHALSAYTFYDLETAYVASKRKSGKVGESSFKQYRSAFNKLQEYFNKQYINNITIEDFEVFREDLQQSGLVNKTVNNIMSMASNALDYAVVRKYIQDNSAKGLESLKEDDPNKENYTDEDVGNILSYEYPENFKNIFTIGAYTGMRVAEIINLTSDDICQVDGTYCFNIRQAKTKSGIRLVPIHKDILSLVLEKMKFPLIEEKSVNASQKAILRQLYKVIDNESTKNFHTFRGTFIAKLANRFPDKLAVIKEIVGHSKGNDKLLMDTYAKGFELPLKKEMLDTVEYIF
jgi:integrase